METIICSGPVIIENRKVLLIKEKKDYGLTPWFFPGGKPEARETNIEEVCRREAKEEMDIDLKITKQLKTTSHEFKGRKVMLYHFLAERIGEIKPGKNIVEWGWFDINNLPNDCAPNVYKIINDLKI